MVKHPDTYWTVKDVAEYLGMKVQTIYNLVHQGTIPFHKIGLKSVRFKKDEIDVWIRLLTAFQENGHCRSKLINNVLSRRSFSKPHMDRFAPTCQIHSAEPFNQLV